ncbi:hypothetical protein DXG01_001454 [Tephrocybe rancida]|nr:hypothetical protein DXG01_001454 [Tephrocybe rancida]
MCADTDGGGQVEAAKAETVLVQPTKAEEADAIPISPAKEEVVSQYTVEDATPVSLSQDVAIPLPLPAPSLSAAPLPQEEKHDNYFLKHDYPKPWSPVRVQRLDGAAELDVDFFEEATSATRSRCGEDWSDYESELSNEDGKYDDEEFEGASGARAGEKEDKPPRKRSKQDQDQDEEDDPDAHDPSFNAELSLSFLPKTRVREAAEGCMGAFNVPPSPMYDSPYPSDSDMNVEITPGMTRRCTGAETGAPARPLPRPHSSAPLHTPLPLQRHSPSRPTSHDDTMIHLRSAEKGMIGLIGRGTPVKRGRKAQ